MFSTRTNWTLTPNAFARAIEESRKSKKEILDLSVSNPTEAGIRPDTKEVLTALVHQGAIGIDHPRV